MTINSEDAERALLSCILTGHPIVDDVAELVQGRDFYQPRNEAVFDACMAVRRNGNRVDPLTLPMPPQAKHYLMELATPENPPLPVHALQYARQVADAALGRRLVEAAQKTIQLATTATDMTQAAEDARQAIDAAAGQVNTAEGGVSVGDGLTEALDWLETPPVTADTPWVDVNDRTNGLLAGQMITVGARPGHGKSLVCKDVALFTAMQGNAAHIATLEMSRNEYMARILASVAKVDLGRMLRRQMSDNDWTKVAQASDIVRDLPLYLDDRPHQSMAQIRAAARQTARRYGKPLGFVGIDYCQLVKPADARQPREQQVAGISRDTKLMAKEFGCPVMLLAQLSRKGAERGDHRPIMTDLRESGALEQDSDQVWLLHRPDQYGDERLGELDLIVGKNRNGPAPQTIALSFQGHYARVVSMV